MMEEKHEELEDVESASSDSFIADSDEEASISAQEDGLHPEEPLTEQEVEELISDFLDVESKAAEAQEALEGESLAKVENDVRDELAQTLHGDDLEKAVADEMTIFREEWEATLDELETESAHLLEQLDGAGIELPSLYKWIEGQAPNGCCTEAWKKRSHWVGCQLSGEIAESIADAEKDLQTQRPVRRKHGRLLEEGASGFLQQKRSDGASKDTVTANSDVDWSCFEKLCSNGASENENSFGSKNWASVYLASTPQQAAIMGLNFPGVNEVEEIEEINDSSMNPLLADAIANEKELVLSEEQKRNFRKVKEEDDEKVDRKFQLHLKHKRYKRRFKQVAAEKEVRSSNGITEGSFIKLQNSDHNPYSLSCEKNAEDVDGRCDKKNEVAGAIGSSEEPVCCFAEPRNDSEEAVDNSKKSKKVIVDSDDESCAGKDSSVSAKSVEKTALHSNMCDLTRVNSVSSRSLTEMFHCTACDRAIIEVQQHPVLKVIICQDCKWLLEEKLRMKNEADCSECYCGWCGGSSDLVNCRSCTTLFCNTCIKRNIGKECLSEAQGSGWLCCCCCPSLVEKLKSELEEAIGLREDVEASTSDTGSDNSDAGIDVAVSSRKRRKKKIRRILDDAELGEETKRKIAIEKERQERLKSMQFPAKYTMLSSSSCNGNLPDEASVEVLGDANTGYIVNVRRENGEEAVRIPPSISAKLKAHQIAGIRFMWENIIQSITNVKSGDKGLGCILAHTMGLGKTFQVIAFLYTAMRSVDLGLKTALIVVPVNVLHNWRQEFGKWRPSEVKPLRVFMLEDVSRDRRADLFAKWRAKGGVFLIGYTAFRNLSLGKYIKDRVMARDFCSALQDGPDILVCDEAHIIKNTRADTTQALKQVKCQRRIALTGSPLQNNLMEYYCMVDFVREGFLGSSLEFRNRFQNPIENGQHTNSTFEDVKIMNQRSHILYEQLKGFVQRMDMSVVKKDLPPKVVFVIAVKLCPLQRTLYKRFLDVYGFTKEKVSNERIRKSFFAGYQALARIWNHPGILQLTKDRLTKDRGYISREDAAENFIADYSSSDENMDYNMIIGDKARTTNDTLQGKNDYGFFQKDWWSDLLQENSYKELDYSGKLVLLLDILTMCSNVGDKALVFSQSIPTLDLIELYLSKLSRQGKPGKYWKKGKDWYRLDGKTESSERQKLVERFNDPTNKRVKCTLISTRAGSLGINLHAANRVIIVDGSWNPTYDLQAIYRAWRYGQKKPVFAYRLMAHGTMEEKIYKRQVTKEGLAARVVDRQQVHRTISKEEMLHLFEFGDDENVENLPEVSQEHKRTNSDMDCDVENSLKQKTGLSHGCCSSDKVMETLLGKHYPRWVANYHEHETLLQENEEEKLSKEEQDMAWEVYRRTLEWEEVQHAPLDETMPDQKPAMSTAAYPVDEPCETQLTQRRGILRDTLLLRKCTKLAHMLTLRSQGTKAGCSTVCGECAQEITWEDLDGNNKIVR